MNKKAKPFIVNNQEDEDGFNLNPGNTVMNGKVKNVLELYPGTTTVNKKPGLIKLQPGRLFVSTRLAEKK